MVDVFFPVSDTGILGKRKSEFSQHPSSCLLRDVIETSTSRHEMRVT